MRALLHRAGWLVLALLLSLALTACGDVGPAATAAPRATLPPAPRETEAPAPAPVDTPAPTETPVPTEAPMTLLQRAEGCWMLYSSEVDGDFHLAEADDSRTFLRFQPDGTVDYLYASPWSEPEYVLGTPVEETDAGLTFTLSVWDEPLTFLVSEVSEEELVADVLIRYDGDILADSHQRYRPSDSQAMDDAPRPLSEEELYALNREDFTRSFFYCTYSRPEEIDWHEVLYDGGGLTILPTEAILADYEAETGWPVELDLEVIPAEDLREFVQRTTGTDYLDARKPLLHRWVYLEREDVYCWEHGDTNGQSIEFTGGWREGDDLWLSFSRGDWQTYRSERWFLAHVRGTEAGWQYLSVTPEAARRPAELLTVEYFDVRPAADHTLPVESVGIEEPYAWRWALLTAQRDGVTVRLDRCAPRTGGEDALATGMGAPALNDRLGDYILNKGETVAAQVCVAWNPTMRVSAAWNGLWGDHWFGEDNALHLDDGGYRPRWVMGHDLNGEGRGTEPWSEEDLVSFLAEPGAYDAWLWYNAAGEAAAALRFSGYRSLDVLTPDQSAQVFLDYDRTEAESYEAPDLLRMEKYDPDADWSMLPEGFFTGGDLGTYRIEYEQLEGEQVLTLTLAEGRHGALGYLLGAPKTETSFTFHRFIGTVYD